MPDEVSTCGANITSGLWARMLATTSSTGAGVPLQCDEGTDFQTFRVGLFGLEKLHNIDRTVGHLEAALDKILPLPRPKAKAPPQGAESYTQ